jgi:hypothetical protein
MNTSAIRAACPVCGSEGSGSLCESLILKGYPLKRCGECGLQLLDPQPDDLTLKSIYQRKCYDAWGIQRDEELTRAMKRSTFGRILRRVRSQFSGSPKLLDCGAAMGYLMEEAGCLRMEPYGVELSEFGAG